MAGIAVVVHVLVMMLLKFVAMVIAQVMKPVIPVQMIVVDVFQMVGHVLIATTVIHGVTVDVVKWIQHVMTQTLHYGKTVNLQQLHVMLHKQNVLSLNLMIAAEYPVVITLLVAALAI